VTSKLNYFLPRESKGQEKNRACACHGFQTGWQRHGLNKTRSFSHLQHCNGSQVYKSYCVNGFRVDSGHDWAPFILDVAWWLHFSWYDFYLFFQEFPSFCDQICSFKRFKC